MSKKYNIKEVAKLFNITTNKIRYYEKQELINPIRDEENDYRIYRGKILCNFKPCYYTGL